MRRNLRPTSNGIGMLLSRHNKLAIWITGAIVGVVALCLWVSGHARPDIWGFGPRRELAAIEVGAERFRIVQQLGLDYFRDQLEHYDPNGSVTIHELDADDHYRQSCSIKVFEAERRLLIIFPGDQRFFEYQWDIKQLTKNGDHSRWF